MWVCRETSVSAGGVSPFQSLSESIPDIVQLLPCFLEPALCTALCFGLHLPVTAHRPVCADLSSPPCLQVKTITSLSLAALAEAASPYGIESFDDVLEPLWRGIRSLRGKVGTKGRWKGGEPQDQYGEW